MSSSSLRSPRLSPLGRTRKSPRSPKVATTAQRSVGTGTPLDTSVTEEGEVSNITLGRLVLATGPNSIDLTTPITEMPSDPDESIAPAVNTDSQNLLDRLLHGGLAKSGPAPGLPVHASTGDQVPLSGSNYLPSLLFQAQQRLNAREEQCMEALRFTIELWKAQHLHPEDEQLKALAQMVSQQRTALEQELDRARESYRHAIDSYSLLEYQAHVRETRASLNGNGKRV